MAQDIGYRWFCGVQKCGCCAVRVNGRELLACWEPAEMDMVIEPLRHAPLVRDLVVDRTPFEDKLMRLETWLQRPEPYPGFPEPLSHRAMVPAIEALKCLACLACQSVCPVLEDGGGEGFIGPAPLVQLAQLALDPRDGADRGLAAARDGGIFQCISCYKCQEVCPTEVKVVDGIIEPLKRRAVTSAPEKAAHARAFLEIVAERGHIDPARLVLKTRGLAALARPGQALRLLFRGKVDPKKSFFPKRHKGAAEVRKLFERTRDKRP
jgi:succinate dehydrogenase/fumarate reductase iron-sulfur protein